MNSTVECQPCNDSNHSCEEDCRVPVGTNITVSCYFKNSNGQCNRHVNVLTFHRIDAEGYGPIQDLPEYQALRSEYGCALHLMLTTKPDTDMIILQCLRTNHEIHKPTYSNTLVIQANTGMYRQLAYNDVYKCYSYVYCISSTIRLTVL